MIPQAFIAGLGKLGCVGFLTDHHSVVRVVWGRQETQATDSEYPILPGISLAALDAGVNPVSTALTSRTPQLYDQPELGRFGFRGMAAAPVLENGGELLGAIALAWVAHTFRLTLAMPLLVATARGIGAGYTRARLEARCACTEVLLKRVFDQVGEAVLLLDDRKRVVHCSPASATVLETSVNKLRGADVQQFLPKSRLVLTHVDSSGKQHFTTRVTDPHDGQTRCDVEVTPVQQAEDSGGRVVLIRRHSPVDGNQVPQPEGADVIVGKNPAFLRCLNLASIAARSNAPVLLVGESGTGKEVFARAIHRFSSRAVHPFISVNCSAIPPELVASEFFGYAPGAFTGARREGQAGKFEAANRGTLFLDEAGDMSPEAQSSLLRILESDYVTPVGSAKNIPIDVRIIAATHRQLDKEVAAGRFRHDLYYRLQVLEIRLVPLRERLDDIPLLAEHFLDSFCSRYGRPRMGLSPEALTCLLAYDWPGNIRELQNVMIQAAHLTDGPIGPEDLPPRLQAIWLEGLKGGRSDTSAEKQLITSVLAEEGGNRTQAARKLGMSRRTLYRKLQLYGLE